MSDKTSSAATIKAKANALMKSGKFVEAILEYSEGIAMQPANAVMYSNRSLAFLKLEQHFFALKDAETTIRLVPDWAKGYYRKGQAEVAAEMFNLAIATYKTGLRSCPCDEMLQKALQEAKKMEEEYLKWKRQMLKHYTIVAGIVGSLLVMGDMLLQPQVPFISHPWIRGIIVTFSAIIGYTLASMIISLQHSNKAILLQPPPELLSGSDLDYNPTTSMASSSNNESVGDILTTKSKSD